MPNAKSARLSSVKTPSVNASARPQPRAPLHRQTAPASTETLMATAQRHRQAAAVPTPMEMEAAPAPRLSRIADRVGGPSRRGQPAPAPIGRGVPIAPHGLLLSSADHSVYWSLQNSGVIYRSSDRKSWTPAFTGVQADLLAGIAPSNTVCWAVGRKGVILLTVDGIHWDRISSPTSSDIIGISAASKDVATIFTAKGAELQHFRRREQLGTGELSRSPKPAPRARSGCRGKKSRTKKLGPKEIPQRIASSPVPSFEERSHGAWRDRDVR